MRAFKAGVDSHSESAINRLRCSDRGIRINIPLFVIFLFGRLNYIGLSLIMIVVLIFLVLKSRQKRRMLLKVPKLLLI